jgi:hypothetical protein
MYGKTLREKLLKVYQFNIIKLRCSLSRNNISFLNLISPQIIENMLLVFVKIKVILKKKKTIVIEN